MRVYMIRFFVLIPGLFLVANVQAGEKVDFEYIREMKAIGLRGLDLDDIGKFAAANVSPEYVREMKASGLHNTDADDVLKLHRANVLPSYAYEMSRVGLRNLDEGDLIKLHNANVDPEYAREMKASGLRNTDADDVLKLHRADVPPFYAYEMSRVGLRNLDADDVIKLHNASITSEFAHEAKSIGMKDADDVINFAQKFGNQSPGIVAKSKPSVRTSYLTSVTNGAAVLGFLLLVGYTGYRVYQRREMFARPQADDLDVRITHFEKRVGDLQDILISIDDRLSRRLKRI